MDNLTKLTMGIGAVVLIILMISFFAIIAGTLVFWLWPVAIPAALPGVVAGGYLAAKLSWWQAVCLTWLCGLLIKSKSTTTNKKD